MQKVKLLGVRNEKTLSSSRSNVSPFVRAWVRECVRHCVLRGWEGAATLQALAVAFYWSVAWLTNRCCGHRCAQNDT